MLFNDAVICHEHTAVAINLLIWSIYEW